ncbi:hypothetical protein V1520DRAFT_349992, partial [Lipomyces starkeyi]
PAPAPQQQELESRAREYIAREKFNRRFTLPATDAHDELTMTYAVRGVDSDTAPTVLFIGGMFGGRLLASMTDHVGQSLGMRIVVIDRPGMGVQQWSMYRSACRFGSKQCPFLCAPSMHSTCPLLLTAVVS